MDDGDPAGLDRRGHRRQAPLLSNVSLALVQVSMFLAAFAGLYFTVSAVTDDTYRQQFFAVVESQLERAVGVRAVYLAARERDVPRRLTGGVARSARTRAWAVPQPPLRRTECG